MEHIQWLGGNGHRRATRHPCLSDIDSSGSKPFDWVVRRAALRRVYGAGAKYAVSHCFVVVILLSRAKRSRRTSVPNRISSCYFAVIM